MDPVKSVPGTLITLKITCCVLEVVVGLKCDSLGYVRRSIPEIASSRSQWLEEDK